MNSVSHLHAPLRYSAGFPIHWEQPLEQISSIGLTFPPRAEVLAPKTQIFFLQHIPFSLVFAYGIDGQDDIYFTRRAFLAFSIDERHQCHNPGAFNR